MPGLHHYQSLSRVPDDLATKSELRSWDLRPGGPPVATVTMIAAVSGVARQEKLYRVTQAMARGMEPAETRVGGIAAGQEFA